MKKRMLLMTAALLAALCTAAAALVPAALADDGEAEERARQARVDGYLAAQFGEGWENVVATCEDYGLGETAEDGVRALLAKGEAECGRFTAVCAVSDARCALTVFAEWNWEPRTPEEVGICAYEVLAEGKRLARLDLPAYGGGIADYEGESAVRGEIEGWANMPRPRTLTLVPVDGEGNEYLDAAMEFALSE